MNRYFLPIILFFISLTTQAQKFTTPNTGVNWTLDSLVQASPSSVTLFEDIYTISEDIELSEMDTLVLRPGDYVLIDSALTITVSGVFLSQGTENNEVVISAVDSLKPYKGFRFEDVSTAIFDYSIVKNGGGLKIITPEITITNSQFLYNTKGIATGAVIDLSYGSPLIQNNRFIRNAKPAVSSPANRTVSARIINNYIEGNNTLNENRPQLNMGTTGDDTLKIIGNTIIGDRSLDRAGGIAVSNLLNSPEGINVIIEGNTIIDNRYGMTIAGGNAFAIIKNNIIEDNDTEGKPNLGGSGISLNAGAATQDITITGNEIRRNLWGITIIGQASANLGDDEDDSGNNIFADNGNGGVVYALYNNTPNTISAKNNCWIEGQESTLEQAGAVIFDIADDASLGEVLYDPILCGETVATEDITVRQVPFYPNPAHDKIFLTGQYDYTQMSILSLDGRQILKKDIDSHSHVIPIQLKPGMYIVEFENTNQKVSHKLIVE